MFYEKSQTQTLNPADFAYLSIKNEGSILSIRLHRPEKMNAMTPVMMNEIVFALEHAKQNKEIRVVELSAEGKVFCAGADLKAFAGSVQELPSNIPTPKLPVKLGDAFNHLYKPCIAKVHANVYAGGFLLIGGCSHVISVDNAQFSLPEIKRGIWPFQVMASLAPIINKRDLLDWCMRGNAIDAHQAHKIGLVSKVVTPDILDTTCDELVNELANQAPLAITKGLEAYDKMISINEQEKHSYLQNMLNELLQSEDAQEGIKAFAEKRAAVWKGE
jgi:methylglutaconyl-CoA hydratase